MPEKVVETGAALAMSRTMNAPTFDVGAAPNIYPLFAAEYGSDHDRPATPTPESGCDPTTVTGTLDSRSRGPSDGIIRLPP